MRIIEAGISGKIPTKVPKKWSDLRLSPDFRRIVEIINPGSAPRPVQNLAFGKKNILENRRNLIVSAPTNSGKSLIATLVMLDAVLRGGRAVLLEPLRALAREKYEELNNALPAIQKILKRKITVRITTGDYRLDNEYFSSPPPESGEIIIATPERLEAILRNSAYENWFHSIGAVCVDEAHLISSPKRGPVLEYLLTSLLCLPSPPRLILLSASLGSTEQAEKWLSPCDVIKVSDRMPPLIKEVVHLAEDEDANEVVVQLAREILSDSAASLVIFVYQTKSAERLARTLNESLTEPVGDDGALAYHSQMSSAKRDFVRESFLQAKSRCLVTTTSLALGINLPATHVIVRDCTFPGVGSLEIPEILQMMGRAGRGDRSGYASVLVRPSDKRAPEMLACELKEEKLLDFCSSFDSRSGNRSNHNESLKLSVATQIAVQIARTTNADLSSLCLFFEASFGGKSLVSHIPDALAWLTDPSRALAYADENRKYRLTKLSARALQSTLPLDVAAGYAQLLRDIIYIDQNDHLLPNWQPLDHLIVLEMLSSQSPYLRPFSEKLVRQVDGWMEADQTRSSLLYNHWIRGDENFSRAVELTGSLNIKHERSSARNDNTAQVYKHAYLSAFRAILLFERGQGITAEEVERKWNVNNLEGIQEQWRDRNLWLLSGLLEILDLPCFYYHLREECNADQERIKSVKKSLTSMRGEIFELLEQLKYCSPLGSFLSNMRRFYKNKAGGVAGHQTIRHLENAGITNFRDMLALKENDLVALGIKRNIAKQINQYISQRLRI